MLQWLTRDTAAANRARFRSGFFILIERIHDGEINRVAHVPAKTRLPIDLSSMSSLYHVCSIAQIRKRAASRC